MRRVLVNARHLCACASLAAAGAATGGSACDGRAPVKLPLAVHFDKTTTLQWPSFVKEAMKSLSDRSDIKVSLGDSKNLENEVDVLIVGGKGMGDEVLRAARPRLIVLPHAGIPASFKSVLEQPAYENIRLVTLHHNGHATAEVAIALLLSVSRRVTLSDKLMREGQWVARGAAKAPKSAHELGGTLLSDRAKVLVVGYGEIGQRVAAVCRAMGMEVVALRRSATVVERDGDVEIHPNSSLRDLLPQSQAVVLALPLTNETRGMISEQELELLPPRAVLINVGRAEIIDEDALWHALQKDGGRHLGFGSDVWWQEPTAARGGLGEEIMFPSSKFPFQDLDNVVMTPHYAGGKGMNRMEEDRVNSLVQVLEAMVADAGAEATGSGGNSDSSKGKVSDVRAGY